MRVPILVSFYALLRVAAALPQESCACPSSSPSVKTNNGTVCGVHIPSRSQDAFFGIPFAQPPVNDLRFRRPQSYSRQYHAYDATTQPTSCLGYGPFSTTIGPLSEDCLYLNVVRPHTDATNLPVLVWIYGGGFYSGGLADPRYNTSTLVETSLHMGKPVIMVSLNYRLSGWGFLASKEVLDDGATNLGLFDQRLALRWVRENIAAFGGDPEKVTIWGESAGAFSVGYQTVAFDGQNDGLFRAAMMDSGTALGRQVFAADSFDVGGYQAMYDDVTRAAGCANAEDSLQCLRRAPAETLGKVFEKQVAQQFWTPIVDGDFLRRLPSESFEKGLAADVAVLLGTNTDEGTLFGPRKTLYKNADVRKMVKTLNFATWSPEMVNQVMTLYPDDPVLGCPFNTGERRFAKQGYQYKRGAAITGDLNMCAGRRGTAKYYARSNKPVYSYRFDQRPWDGVETGVVEETPVGVAHFVEVAFVFNNTTPQLPNWIGPHPSYHRLSGAMSRTWLAFAHDLNPNGHGLDDVPHWPEYQPKHPKNMVYRADDNKGGSFVEVDDYRSAQLAFWNSNWQTLRT